MRILVPDEELAGACRERLQEKFPDRGKQSQIRVWDIDSGVEPPSADFVVTARPKAKSGYSRIGLVRSLRHVHLLSLGYDWIRGYLPKDVSVSNSKGAIESTTAEFALTLTLAALRDLTRVYAQAQERFWSRDFWTSSLVGSRVLVLGYGGVGRATVRRVESFAPASVEVIAGKARLHKDGRRINGPEALYDLLGTADVVIVTLPHNESTDRLVNVKFLKAMTDGALLVNVGRSAIVDHSALVAELRSHRLRAALDVVEPEPLPEDSDLWDVPNLLLSPHLGGNTYECIRRCRELAIEQVVRFGAGEPVINVVSR
ncbi:NAD(P)-dependent oxidoreductase [Nesterenkonia ebinurensis]|uniref:NAD(P)-dependent oxidoreductase n=1 Tax=Nesterenkonia ebinurensis TaxID=2608252 RepID=UPI00168BBED9|nr:NAD(P)-dependent oxidoreductase [Nesterenkonia ebinurensis]